MKNNALVEIQIGEKNERINTKINFAINFKFSLKDLLNIRMM